MIKVNIFCYKCSKCPSPSTQTHFIGDLRKIVHVGKHLQLFLLMLITFEVSAQPYQTLVAPIFKDINTSLYSTTLNFHEHYVLSLDSPFLWYHCEIRHPPVACVSSECIEARSYLSSLCPSSNNTLKHGQRTCVVTPVNPITKSCAAAQLTYNDLIISWTNGRNPTVGINFNHLYVSCAPKSLLQSLPSHTIGVAGLLWFKLALSNQFTPLHIGVSKKFAICLPSTRRTPGVIFFGDGPYYMLPPTNLDVASVLSFTPLLRHPSSPEYYIGINAILINGKPILFPKTSTLQMDSLGHGGVKVSTMVPYTTLRSDIYKPFVKDFKKDTQGIPRAKVVEPFDLCINTSSLGSTRVGLPVPNIDLELGNRKNWTIFGSNSMKMMSNDVACLVFVDGGEYADQAIVIGSFQIENNFLLFDLVESRLGFSSSLFFVRTTCGNFNFTSQG